MNAPRSWLAVALIVLVPWLGVTSPLADRLRAIGARTGEVNDELERLRVLDAGASQTIESAATLERLVAERDQRSAELDRKIAAARSRVRDVERLMGWDDTGWNGLLGFIDKWVVSSVFRGDYGPHETRYWREKDELDRLVHLKSTLAEDVDRELEFNTRKLPRSLAALRRAAESASLDADRARREQREAAERSAALRAELERLASEERALQGELRRDEPGASPTPGATVSPSPVPRRITASVVDVSGHGRAELFEPIERCTWKFAVEFRDEAGQPWRSLSGRVEKVELTPPDIQKTGLPAPTIGVTSFAADAPLRAGPFYLTVQKPDGYRGSFRGVFVLDGTRVEVSWTSPGRPPVGPPQVPPTAQAPIELKFRIPGGGRLFRTGFEPMTPLVVRAVGLPPGDHAIRVQRGGRVVGFLWGRSVAGHPATDLSGSLPLGTGPVELTLTLQGFEGVAPLAIQGDLPGPSRGPGPTEEKSLREIAFYRSKLQPGNAYLKLELNLNMAFEASTVAHERLLRGDHAGARDAAREAIQFIRDSGARFEQYRRSQNALFVALDTQASIACYEGNLAELEAQCRNKIAYYRALEAWESQNPGGGRSNACGIARTLQDLALEKLQQAGDLAVARQLCSQADAEWRRCGKSAEEIQRIYRPDVLRPPP